MFFTYIVLCQDDTYYTGHTEDINSRMKQHMEGSGARYTRQHRFSKLVLLEEFDTRSKAMRREREIKKMNRMKKFNLIESGKENTFSLMDKFYDFLAR